MAIYSLEGRATRLEWWIVSVVANLAGIGLLFLSLGGSVISLFMKTAIPAALTYVGYVISFMLLYVALAASVRRYHDRNKSGWWILVLGIPVFGAIWQLVELGFLKGTEGANAYDGVQPSSVSQTSISQPPVVNTMPQAPADSVTSSPQSASSL